MTNTLKALMASAAVGLALTACKGAEKAEQMAAEVVQTITLPSGVSKVETVAPAKGDQVVIPYTKFVLDNGFEVQRETVSNERGQRIDNRPYGLLRERVGEAMYPEGHPYSWSTIGYLEDIQRADLTDLKKFFLEWYGPNNATLTIGGDFDTEQTLEWIKTYFGTIPAGPEQEDPVFEPITLDEDRYISLEDNVQLPLLYMSWPTVHANHPDEAPLDVLSNILGQGQTSILYKNIQKPGLTLQAASSHGCREIHCSFALFTHGLESVSGKVSQLAAYQTYRDTPNGIGDDIARYENVTKADVMRVYNQYIKGQNAVIMSIVPKGATSMIAREDTWQRYERTIPDFTDTEDDFQWSSHNHDQSAHQSRTKP